MKMQILYALPIFLVLLMNISNSVTNPSEETTPYETTYVVTSQMDEPIPIQDPNLEWKVAVGDVMTYTYTKLYFLNDFDGDGDPYTLQEKVKLENGTMINLTMKVGLTFSYEILSLNDHAMVQKTIDGEKLLPMDFAYGISVVCKTVDNRTYWEEQARIYSDEDYNISVEGSLVGSQSIDHWNDETYERKWKYHWKTGWLAYSYSKWTNSTHLLSEREVIAKGLTNLTPGFEFSPVSITFVIFSVLIFGKRKKKF